MPLISWAHSQYWAGVGAPPPTANPLDLTLSARDLALSFKPRHEDVTLNARRLGLTLPAKRE